jgi:hypothetical protein
MFLKEFRRPLTTAGHRVSWLAMAAMAGQAWALPVPGYVPPVTEAVAPAYVDDTRGVYVPSHDQLRMKTEGELSHWQGEAEANKPYYTQHNPGGAGYERQINTVAEGVPDETAELDRIGSDPGLLAGGKRSADARLYARDSGAQYRPDDRQLAQLAPRGGPAGPDLSKYPSLAAGGADIGAAGGTPRYDGGEELAVGQPSHPGNQVAATVDMQNGLVRLKEERISVRRALQRMLDQIGGGSWTVVWDLDEQNAGLPDMEISLYAEEPFVNVLNALLARLQTRSGQPLRVIKYERTQRLVITDRVGGDVRAPGAGSSPAAGGRDVAVTESVLKEATVSLHYDEIPLVDALENIINQAGKGQWRLRMYAGTDQVLKPAHIEEPFGVAIERILKIFNLRYEVFPGGKLIVVTGGNRFGYQGIQ